MNGKATAMTVTSTAALAVIAVAALTLALHNERTENRKLREAFSAVVERSKWSCDIDEGERIICAVKEGAISRLALAQDDQVVSAKGVASPLGKAPAPKKKRRRG